MDLFLRDNDLSEWLDLGNGAKFKLAYPTAQQEKELSASTLQISLAVGEDEKFAKTYLEYWLKLLKYTVKDWDGVNNARTGEPVKFATDKDGNMDDELLRPFAAYPELLSVIGEKIKKQIDFTETDKKKL